VDKHTEFESISKSTSEFDGTGEVVHLTQWIERAKIVLWFQWNWNYHLTMSIGTDSTSWGCKWR
jgi:hypothetical protein